MPFNEGLVKCITINREAICRKTTVEDTVHYIVWYLFLVLCPMGLKYLLAFGLTRKFVFLEDLMMFVSVIPQISLNLAAWTKFSY